MHSHSYLSPLGTSPPSCLQNSNHKCPHAFGFPVQKTPLALRIPKTPMDAPMVKVWMFSEITQFRLASYRKKNYNSQNLQGTCTVTLEEVQSQVYLATVPHIDRQKLLNKKSTLA